jgi:outer membrane protein OmpA-like peptidoglycan-associated protein
MKTTLLAAVAALLALSSACADPRKVNTTLTHAEQTITQANAVYARLCAPEEIANAESGAAFTRVEFHQGDVRRAQDHANYADQWAILALEKATPCGTADFDKDKIVDIVDQCPKEPEDYDGVNDEDGCRDIDPNGDEDGDGIKNMDDGCMFEPEDFDMDQDEDGCPETSEDTDGDGIINAIDQCVTDPEDLDGFKDSDGCPDPDNDDDGVVDLNDACVKVPEDKDAWEDDDGCPEPDNDLDTLPDTADACPNEPGDRVNNGCPNTDRDKDGIADGNDKCPDVAENVNQYLDDDGCPDNPPSRVVVTRERIEIKDTIQFEVGKATLLAASFPVLKDVATVMKDAPDIKIRIEGHTDSDGSDASNLTLSQARAESVLAYLQQQGIDASRMTAQGFGETRPIDTNRTTAGKAKNRRVEFHIVSQ